MSLAGTATVLELMQLKMFTGAMRTSSTALVAALVLPRKKQGEFPARE